MHDPTRVDPVAVCATCGHHALQIREVRAIEEGAELHLSCRACNEGAVLTIAETAHPSGDELASSLTATTRARPRRTAQTAKEVMVDRLGEAEAHAEAIVRLTESEAFLEAGIYARETASTLGRLHGFAWWSAGRLAEHLAITRKALEEATPRTTRLDS